MEKSEQIYFNPSSESFKKLLWRLFWPYFLIHSLLSCIPLLNIGGSKPAIIFWVLLMLSLIIYRFFECRRWVFYRIKSIQIKNSEEIILEIIQKDDIVFYNAPVHQFKVISKWHGGKAKVLRVTLLIKERKIANIYSGTDEASIQKLEGIKYKLQKYLT